MIRARDIFAGARRILFDRGAGERRGSRPPAWLETELSAYVTAVSMGSTPAQGKAVGAVVRTFLQTAPAAWTRDPGQAVGTYLAAQQQAGRALKTLLNHRSALVGWLRHLEERHRIADARCSSVVKLATPEELPARYLREDEVRSTVDLAAGLGISPEIRFDLATGLRLSELIRMKWDDVDNERRIVLVRKAKGKRPRSVPLSDEALAALADQRAAIAAAGFDPDELLYVFPARRTWRGGWKFVAKPRRKGWWGRAMKPIQEAIPRFTTDAEGSRTGRAWHLLRHTFASRLAQRGVSLYKLAQWLGHRDTKTTQMYAHLQQGYDPDIERASLPKAPAEGRQP